MVAADESQKIRHRRLLFVRFEKPEISHLDNFTLGLQKFKPLHTIKILGDLDDLERCNEHCAIYTKRIDLNPDMGDIVIPNSSSTALLYRSATVVVAAMEP